MAQKRVFQITTPRGSVYQTKGKGGTVTARLEWNPGFAKEKSEAFSNAQAFVDSECLRYMDPLTSRLTGYMIKSATLERLSGVERLSTWPLMQGNSTMKAKGMVGTGDDCGLRG